MSATAALSALLGHATTHHAVTILGYDASCSCGNLKVSEAVWGPRMVQAVAHAHIANPTASVAELVEFIGRGVVAPTVDSGLVTYQ